MRRATFTRDFYIPGENRRPDDFAKHTDEDTGAVWYTWSIEIISYENPRIQWNLVGFSGKRQKPDKNYVYSSPTQRAQRIEEWLDGLRATAKFKAERAAERLTDTHTLKVNDILYTMWGYDQTNIDFYQVIEVVSRKTVRIREIAQNRKHDERAFGGTCTPRPDCFLDNAPVLTKRAGKHNSLRITGYAYASLWDGRELSWSDGH